MLITNIGQLVTPIGQKQKTGKDMADLKIIKNAFCLITDGVISKVGNMKDITPTDENDIFDAQGKVVIPGLVDPHTHAVFYGSREDEFLARCQGEQYSTGGIQFSTELVRKASEGEIYDYSLPLAEEIISKGTTLIEMKSGYGLNLENEMKLLRVINRFGEDLPIEVVPTFLGAHSIPKGKKKEDYIDELVKKMIPEVANSGLAEFCDIFCEVGYFDLDDTRKILLEAKKAGFKLKIHADEIKPLGGAELTSELGITSAEHLLQISPKGTRSMKNSDTIAVLLPGTAFTLNTKYAPAREMIDSGVPVALGTDFNPGTCLINSMFIIISLAVMKMKMSLEESITAATLNAACAIDRGNSHGSIEKGKCGDIIILELDDYKQIPYFFGHNYVDTVIKRGEMVNTQS